MSSLLVIGNTIFQIWVNWNKIRECFQRFSSVSRLPLTPMSPPVISSVVFPPPLPPRNLIDADLRRGHIRDIFELQQLHYQCHGQQLVANNLQMSPTNSSAASYVSIPEDVIGAGSGNVEESVV